MFAAAKQQIQFLENIAKRLNTMILFKAKSFFLRIKNWILSGKGYPFSRVVKMQKFFPYRDFALFLKVQLYSSKTKIHRRMYWLNSKTDQLWKSFRGNTELFDNFFSGPFWPQTDQLWESFRGNTELFDNFFWALFWPTIPKLINFERVLEGTRSFSITFSQLLSDTKLINFERVLEGTRSFSITFSELRSDQRPQNWSTLREF